MVVFRFSGIYMVATNVLGDYADLFSWSEFEELGRFDVGYVSVSSFSLVYCVLVVVGILLLVDFPFVFAGFAFLGALSFVSWCSVIYLMWLLQLFGLAVGGETFDEF